MFQPIGGELRAPPEVKRTLCKFFLAGTCDRGELCTWAHGDHEVGQPITQPMDPPMGGHSGPPQRAMGGQPIGGPMQAIGQPMAMQAMRQPMAQMGQMARPMGQMGMMGQQMPPMVQQQIGGYYEHQAQPFMDPAFQMAPGAVGMGHNAKRTICKFWQQGLCSKGMQCSFAHGVEDLQPQPQMPPIQAENGLRPLPSTKRTICRFWEEGSCTRGELCTFAHGEQEIGTPVPLAVPEPEPIEATTKRTICKFWQEGSCTRGSECTWAHGEEELGEVVALGTKRPRVEMAKGKGKSAFGSVFQAPPMFLPFEAHDAAPVKRTLCKFWLEGQCSRGESCTWAHGVEDQLVGHQMAPVGEVRRTVCKFWQQGKCNQASGQCTWAHGEWELGTIAPCGATVRDFQEPHGKRLRMA